MASHVIVTDSTARRAKIAVTPNKYLSDVLEEALKKLGVKDFQTGSYGLKNNKKTVDLSIPFRQSGLPPGAKLELTLLSKSPTVVTICLRVADPNTKAIPSSGLEEKFKSTTTLWEVLRIFESGGSSGGANFNFTARGVAQTDNGTSAGSGQIYYETPVLNVMGRDMASFQEFQKTLSQLGMASGRFMLRLSFRKTDTPLAEAMSTIQEFFQDVQQTPEKGTQAGDKMSEKAEVTDAAPSSGDTPMPDAPSETQQAQPAGAQTSSQPEPISSDPAERPITVFSAPTSDTPRAALLQEHDSDYEPTIAHAKLYQARLKENSHNQRLLSDAEQAEQAAAKAAAKKAITTARIRVKFPDASIVQFDVSAADTGSDVYEQVRRVIRAVDAGFALKFTGPKGLLTLVPPTSDVKVIGDLGFDRGMMVHFLWDENVSPEVKTGPVLKEAYASAAKEFEVPVFENKDVEAEDGEAAKPVKEEKKSSAGGGAGGKGMPKWFKGLGKK